MFRQYQDDAYEEVSTNLNKTIGLVKSMEKVHLVQRSINTAIKEDLPEINGFLAEIVKLHKVWLKALYKKREMVGHCMSAQALR